MILAVCISALVFCPAGIVSADEETELPNPGVTPDSPFYFFDELVEQISLRFTLQAEAKAEKALQFAEERLAEMNCMMARNNVKAAIRAMNGYTARIDTAIEAVAAMGNQGAGTQAMLALGMAKHTAILDDITGETPEEAREVMIQTRERAHVCQQMALGLLEQEDPEMATQVKLKLTERQCNSVRVMAENEATANVQEDTPETTAPNGQASDDTVTQTQGNAQGQPTAGEQKAGWGESSNGEGPGLENQWGTDTKNEGAEWGETSGGAGPDLQNQWGQANN
jgi:hypothetical protein